MAYGSDGAVAGGLPARRLAVRLSAGGDDRPYRPAALTPAAPAVAIAAPPTHDAVALTGGGTQALIRLDDQVYTLRITRAGKLILNK
jgi:hemin uptake protein HemP